MRQSTYYKSPFGTLTIIHDTNNIFFLKKIGDSYKETPDCELTVKLKSQLDEYFAGKRQNFEVPYILEGTEFQKKVWKALDTIPYGTTASYKDMAIKVGNPKASRAIGMANNKNPITIIVPCHRVIGNSGKLVGYAGGLPMKETILEIERKNKND